MESPFGKHRDKVLGHYSTASWLRRVVLAMWRGSAHPVTLSPLTNVDAEHFSAFVEMVTHYRKVGENDPAFMRLAEEVLDRLAEEQSAAAREDKFDEWLRAVRHELRGAGKPPTLADDRYEWFSGRFDAEDSPEIAARACQPLAAFE